MPHRQSIEGPSSASGRRCRGSRSRPRRSGRGRGGPDRPRPPGAPRPRAGRLPMSTAALTPLARSQLGEIAGKAVRDVHGGTRHGADERRLAASRGCGMEIAVGRAGALVVRERGGPGRGLRGARSPRAASPMVPVTQTTSPSFAAVRRTMRPAGTSPRAVIESVSAPVGPNRVAAEERTAEVRCRVRQTRGEIGEPGRRPVVRQRQGQQEADRVCALGGEVRDVHAERLAGDRSRPVVGQEMDVATRASSGERRGRSRAAARAAPRRP